MSHLLSCIESAFFFKKKGENEKLKRNKRGEMGERLKVRTDISKVMHFHQPGSFLCPSVYTLRNLSSTFPWNNLHFLETYKTVMIHFVSVSFPEHNHSEINLS